MNKLRIERDDYFIEHDKKGNIHIGLIEEPEKSFLLTTEQLEGYIDSLFTFHKWLRDLKRKK